MENSRYTVSIKGVVFKEHRVILLLNERREWELPGGRIEAGESPTECLVREFKEELDIDVRADVLLDTYLYEVIPKQHVFIVTYGCSLTGEFAPKISEEHVQVGDFDIDALPINLPDGYRKSILTWHSRSTQR
jgi:mutator protein MutT